MYHITDISVRVLMHMESSQDLHGVSSSISHVLQMKKLRLKEIKQSVRGQTSQ